MDFGADILKALFVAGILYFFGWLGPQINLAPLGDAIFSKNILLSYFDLVIMFTIIWFILKRARISERIKKTTTPPMYSGKINQGESLTIGNVQIQLDDLSKEGDYLYAAISLSFINEKGKAQKLDVYKIQNGTSEEIDLTNHLLIIEVEDIMMGYTFGAKWTQLKVWLLKKE